MLKTLKQEAISLLFTALMWMPETWLLNLHEYFHQNDEIDPDTLPNRHPIRAASSRDTIARTHTGHPYLHIEGQKKGFSLVELMIVIAILGLLCAIALPILGVGINTSEREASARRNAQSYAQQLQLDIKGITCSGADSDQDGYTSCTIMTNDGNMHPVECGYNMLWAPLGQNTSCKMAMPKLNVSQVR